MITPEFRHLLALAIIACGIAQCSPTDNRRSTSPDPLEWSLSTSSSTDHQYYEPAEPSIRNDISSSNHPVDYYEAPVTVDNDSWDTRLHNAGWYDTASTQQREALIDRLLPLWKYDANAFGIRDLVAERIKQQITPNWAASLLDERSIAEDDAFIVKQTEEQYEDPEIQYIMEQLHGQVSAETAETYAKKALLEQGLRGHSVDDILMHVTEAIRRDHRARVARNAARLQRRPRQRRDGGSRPF